MHLGELDDVIVRPFFHHRVSSSVMSWLVGWEGALSAVRGTSTG